ncbi:chaperone protein dnaJ 49-like [Dioscorea cayenensis subsp. rotundata]|uniref:Chaperone protein dnaJ 49-like n=1 Tax=Dioscorea cayennensis subsp. rotundata TaxID=55577 RepID=A0AB40BD47_DIOCR|nr:chaperone protein dnaJ 49-like [Dioscorea cayenensis subsp. rotundata]
MDGNKDDALKCLRIGKVALESGDKGRALKFLSKAHRLDPSLPIDELLSAALGGESQDESSSSNGVNPSDAPPAEEAGNTDSAFASTASSSTTARTRISSNGSAARGCTQEQIAIVREIKKQKDFYKILDLERNCTIEDVRKAYRKISLKVHPDKNSAPGSDEAFKAVSKAFQCLSNEESRKRYDLVGSEELNYGVGRPAARNNYHGFNGFYESDFDADEIFRNFFFGGGPMQTTPFGTFHFRTGGMGRHTANEMHGGGGGSNLRILIQILPVILLLLLNFLPSSEPVYSLSQSYQHDYKVETPRGVPYYVKRDKFEKDYPYQSSERLALEKRIEREYIGILSQNCRVELQRQRWGLSYETPYCDMLQKFD